MTAKERLKENSTKGWLIIILCLFLSLKSCVVKGGTAEFCHHAYGNDFDGYLLTDTAKEKANRPIFLGYELALARPVYTLKSDLAVLNHLRVGSLGVIVGGVAGNRYGKLKVNAGLYYSDAAVPYTFDLFTAGVSANVYLLRLVEANYHTIEPYLIGSISRQHVTFYGNYLSPMGSSNYSTSEERFLAREFTTQFNVGLGAEYQLENDEGCFIHLFGEVTYGVPVATRCSEDAFKRTQIMNPFAVSVGLSFGTIKKRNK